MNILLDKETKILMGFSLKEEHVVLTGICAKCQA